MPLLLLGLFYDCTTHIVDANDLVRRPVDEE